MVDRRRIANARSRGPEMSEKNATPAEHSVARSMAVYARAQAVIPGVTQLLSRRPTQAALGVSPVYADRAKGCRIWDVDGNEYVDWMSGVGPIILGYADEVVDAAVRRQIEKAASAASYTIAPWNWRKSWSA